MLITTYAPAQFVGFAARCRSNYRPSAYRGSTNIFKSPLKAMADIMVSSAQNRGSSMIQERDVKVGIAAYYNHPRSKSITHSPIRISRLAANFASGKNLYAYNAYTIAYRMYGAAKLRLPKIRLPEIKIPRFTGLFDGIEWLGNLLKKVLRRGVGLFAIFAVVRAIAAFFGIRANPASYFAGKPQQALIAALFSVLDPAKVQVVGTALGASSAAGILSPILPLFLGAVVAPVVIRSAYGIIKKARDRLRSAPMFNKLGVDKDFEELQKILENADSETELPERQRKRVEVLLARITTRLTKAEGGLEKIKNMMETLSAQIPAAPVPEMPIGDSEGGDFEEFVD